MLHQLLDIMEQTELFTEYSVDAIELVWEYS